VLPTERQLQQIFATQNAGILHETVDVRKRSFAQRAGRPSSIDLFLSLSDLAITRSSRVAERVDTMAQERLSCPTIICSTN
jgi:hypothetical protein